MKKVFKKILVPGTLIEKSRLSGKKKPKAKSSSLKKTMIKAMV